MFGSKRAIFLRFGSPNITHHAANNHPALIKYVPNCFSSVTQQGPAMPGKVSRKDGTLEGPEDGYGGSGISNHPTNHPMGPPPTGDPIIPMESKTAILRQPGGDKTTIVRHPGGERRNRREEMDTEDAARDAAGFVADTAKAGMVGALEVGLRLGETAKRTMDGVWDAAKKTMESVRDSVADDDDDGDNNGDHRLPKRTTGGRGEGLGRGPGGYKY